MIMNIVWKRVSDTGKNWRHVYKVWSSLQTRVDGETNLDNALDS